MDASLNPLFSVLIPVFNRSFELQRTLISLESQSLKNFEVILCDDGSDENIIELVNLFNHKFPIKYKKIQNSGGPARPRNVALGLASGDWICFLDSDDCWDSNRMEEIEGHIRGDIDLFYHVMRTKFSNKIYKRDSRKKIGDYFSKLFLYDLVTVGNFIPNSSVIIKKSTLLNIGGISEDVRLRGIEDYDAWLRVAEAGGKFKFINKCLGTYWFSSTSLSVITKERIIAEKFLYKSHRKHYLLFKSQARAAHFYKLGTLFLSLGNKKMALKHFIYARYLSRYFFRCKRIIQITRIFFMLLLENWFKK
jgi:glycosyltransferase involved in cell wall biosynthesis